MDGFGQEAVLWRKHRVARLVLGFVGVVAVDAVVALPIPPGEVPVAVHPPVGSTPEVACLRPMALGTQLQSFGAGQHLTVCQAQLVRLPFVVTGAAVEVAVVELQARVELLELPGRRRQRRVGPLRMATHAGDALGSSECVDLTARHTAEALTTNAHLSTGRSRGSPELVHTRSIGTVARRGTAEDEEVGE